MDFVMSGCVCVGVLVICVLVFTLFCIVCTVFVYFLFMYIYSYMLLVYRLLPSSENSIVVNNNNNNNNNNRIKYSVGLGCRLNRYHNKGHRKKSVQCHPHCDQLCNYKNIPLMNSHYGQSEVPYSTEHTWMVFTFPLIYKLKHMKAQIILYCTTYYFDDYDEESTNFFSAGGGGGL